MSICQICRKNFKISPELCIDEEGVQNGKFLSPVDDARNLRFMYNFVSRENVILKEFVKKLFRGDVILKKKGKSDDKKGKKKEEEKDGDAMRTAGVYDEDADLDKLTLAEDVVRLVSEEPRDLK